MTKKVVFIESKKFAKEVKDLTKKYRSLPNDLDLLRDGLKLFPESHIPIAGIGEGYEGKFFKVKKFICQSINKNSKNSNIRIIYRYLEVDDIAQVEMIHIDFIEIYHKNTKKEFDHKRLEPYRTQD